MTFSYQDCLSIEEILADVLVRVDDEKLKQFTLGWYKRQIKSGMEKLNFSAPFIKTYKDVSITPNLRVPIPKGVWDLIDLFIWNPKGECDQACVMGETIRLFHKRNYMTDGYGKGYTARHMSHTTDYQLGVPFTQDNALYFYNTHMGDVLLSDSCYGFEKLRLYYHGVATDIDSVRFIPPFLRDVLIAWGALEAFTALKARDPNKYRILWADAKSDLYDRNGLEGSKWDTAQSLLLKIDRKAWNDLSEYLGQINA